MRGVWALGCVVLLWGCAADTRAPSDAGVMPSGAAAAGSAGTAGADAASAVAGNTARLPDAGPSDAATTAAVDAADTAPAVRARDGGARPRIDAARPVGRPAQFDAAVATACQDEDGDGFGIGCMAGEDCDDADPAVTDACYRCVEPNEGCPCDAGTRPVFCMAPTLHVDGGTYVCSEGSRYCRDGVWSACEAIGEYVFVPNG